MRFLNEFRAFAMRGNVIDLAVAVVMGAAFNKIVSSLVDGIVMPSIGLLLGGINIADKTFTLGHAVIKWGSFLQSLIDFVIISFSILIVVKAINSLQKKEAEKPPAPSEEIILLTQIRDSLQK